MIFAMFRVMALSVVRDRGALAMAFLLPPTIFIIFAAIFSGTSGEEMRLKVSVGVGARTAQTDRLISTLRSEDSLRLLPETLNSREAVAREVEAAHADVGLFIENDL